MSFCIGFGKFNKFYWLIIGSALLKLLINGLFKIEYHDRMNIVYLSILNQPELNDHIFIRFIYYYLGFICLGILFQKLKISKQQNEINYKKDKNELNSGINESETNLNSNPARSKSTSLIHHNYLLEISQKAFRPLILAVILYILNEMINFYFNQKNYGAVNFWILEIFFIHLLYFKKNKLKLYKHQILAFSIIILFSFGIKFISAFTQQCIYPEQDPNDIDEKFKEIIKNIDENMLTPGFIMYLKMTLRKSVIETNEEGVRKCKNKYNILLIDKYFEYLIIFSAIGYLIGLFLHSYSAVKFKYYIERKYISPYLIIIFIGIIGFFSNIILLIISQFKSCGGENKYIANFCHSMKYKEYFNESKNKTELLTYYYFDNFYSYITRLNDAFHPYNNTNIKKTYNYGPNVKKPIDGIFEIVISFIFPIFAFFKTTFDLFIIKELGVFHILFPEVIYQFIKDLTIIIYKIIKNLNDSIQTIQFIFIGLSNFFAIIGFGIYLELREIRCCGFDYNLKQNIIYRGLLDFKESEADENNDNRLSDLDDRQNSLNENGCENTEN